MDIENNPYNTGIIESNFVDSMIRHAIQQSSSDIHIEPMNKHYQVRYRRDGILYKISHIDSHLAARIIARLKVMANLDICEKRSPQDGRFQIQSIDVRINICPTLHGEKVVLRLLDANKFSLNINDLGLNPFQKTLFINKISEPTGMILVTGPTGSGKTFTLYSALNYINSLEKNISTVEDPIEIQLNGINQMNINPKVGLDFSTALKSLLRQDPDIIMVGEIRDKETAEIAIQAAHTGHLVFSTLHSNNSLEAITRLTAMGIPIYNMISSISLIVAQRLIRKLCPLCKKKDLFSKNIDDLKNYEIYTPVGCDHCLNGFHSRTGIYEFLPFTEEIKETILMRKKIESNNLFSLREAGLEKIKNGMTSLSELDRVL